MRPARLVPYDQILALRRYGQCGDVVIQGKASEPRELREIG